MKKAFNPCLWLGLAALIVLVGIFLVRNAIPSPAIVDPTQISESTAAKININTANETELMQLPGIGPSTAEAIVKYRAENGPFTDPSQLMNIPGIGQQKLLTLLENIYWEE